LPGIWCTFRLNFETTFTNAVSMTQIIRAVHVTALYLSLGTAFIARHKC